jgi:hypothetical protein
MCEAIGSEPLEEEIPPDFEELLYESQMAIVLYNYFPDSWSGGMSSFYVGKIFTNIEYIFNLFNIPEGSRIYILNFMLLIDQENARTMNEKLRQK